MSEQPEQDRRPGGSPLIGREAPVSRSERRIYLGGGAWAPVDAAPSPSQGAVRAAGRVRRGSWPARVVLTLPLVLGAAPAAGAGVYLIAVAATVGDPGSSRAWQLIAAAGALAVSALLMSTCGLLLRERPCCRLGVAVWGTLMVAALVMLVVAILGPAEVPIVGAAVILAYAAVVLGSFWLARRLLGEEDDRLSPAPAARSTATVRGGVATWVVRSLGALVALAAALATAFVAFSLWTVSFLPGQVELGWEQTLFSAAWQGGSAHRLFHVSMLALACLGSAAFFALLVWAAARALGAWRGRVSFWWAVTMAVLVLLGVVAWLADGTLPKG